MKKTVINTIFRNVVKAEENVKVNIYRDINREKKKIQVRQITDINKNTYKIYDVLKKDSFGNWRYGKETYFSLEEAVERNPGVEIEDLTKNR